MIRDEFKKQSAKSMKEIAEIRKIGERQFYTKKVLKIKETLKTYNFVSIFSLLLGIVPLIQFVLIIINDVSEMSFGGWLGFAVSIAGVVWATIWFAIIRPILKSKYKKYQNSLQEVIDKELKRQKAVFEFNQRRESK